jgi:hypothetical protein
MVAVGITDPGFQQILGRLMRVHDDDYVFEVIQILLGHGSVEDGNGLLDSAIDRLVSSDFISAQLKSYIYSLSVHFPKVLTKERPAKICSIRNQDPNFFEFMKSLVNKNVITEEGIELIGDPVTEFNDEFSELLERVLTDVNLPKEKTISTLSLKGEQHLWKIALTESQIRLKIASLLYRLYAANDGGTLTDLAMIDTYIENWIKLFKC